METVSCYDTITYSTHGDFTFLSNLLPLVERSLQLEMIITNKNTEIHCRWQGQVSVALYAPGEDFESTTATILNLRNCHQQSHLVRKFVTFHIFLEAKFVNYSVTNRFEDIEEDFLCSEATSIESLTLKPSFKAINNLTFPINVARNLARDAALTHFLLFSDIELFPNPGLIDSFLQMISSNPAKYLMEKQLMTVLSFSLHNSTLFISQSLRSSRF